MKYIFWNVQKRADANDYIYKMITKYQPDIVGIAEYEAKGKILEKPMIAASALQAVPSREIAKKCSRVYKNKERIYYYNPMWNFLGDEKRPMGTYYHKSPGNRALYWNTFDQFVVSSALADKVNTERIEIISQIRGVTLTKKSGIPGVSDHFPIFFEIEEVEDEKLMEGS